MKAVILAGGKGTRLREETEIRPKPMVEIGGRPILWHIMKIYAHHGIHDFVICLGYKGEVIKKYFADYMLLMSDVTVDMAANRIHFHHNAAESWRVTLVDTGAETLTGGRLKRVAGHLDGPFCMTYGDGLGDVDITASIDAFHRAGRQALVTAVQAPGRFGALDLDGDRVAAFAEKPPHGGWINGGFFVLDPAALDHVDGDETYWEQEPLARLTAAGELVAWRHHGFWQPMDTLRDKLHLDALWDSGRAPWKVWS